MIREIDDVEIKPKGKAKKKGTKENMMIQELKAVKRKTGSLRRTVQGHRQLPM